MRMIASPDCVGALGADRLGCLNLHLEGAGPSVYFIVEYCRAPTVGTPPHRQHNAGVAGQDLGSILADLLSVEPLLGSPRRHDRRAVAVTLVSVVEQFCRLAVADMLGRGRGTMPDYVEVPLASIGSAARLSKETLVSFAYNFHNIAAIEKMLQEYGMRGVLAGNPGLRAALVALFAARNDLVHTSVPVSFDMRAGYDAVLRFVFGIAGHLPELEADMRLVEGDVFMKMRMPSRSRAAYGEAEQVCRALALKIPESAQAHARLGLALSGLGRHADALASYGRAAALDPGRAATHLDMALPFARLGRHADALASCARASDIDPSLPDAHLVGADILAGLGRDAEALASCDRAIALDGSLPKAHLLRGNILAGMGRADEALAAYDAAAGLDEYDEVAHMRRADLLAAAGRADEALAACDAAAGLDPLYAEAHFRKAVILVDLGRHDDAVYCYNRAIDLDPRHVGALAGKGAILSRLGRSEEAAECRGAARRLERTAARGRAP